MTIESTSGGGVRTAGTRSLSPWLTTRRIFMLAGVAAAAFGVFLNWNWLTAIGAVPILLAVAPCLAMCALGLCMRGGGAKSCATLGKADVGSPPDRRHE